MNPHRHRDIALVMAQSAAISLVLFFVGASIWALYLVPVVMLPTLMMVYDHEFPAAEKPKQRPPTPGRHLVGRR